MKQLGIYSIIVIATIILIGLFCGYESTYTRQAIVTKCENSMVYCIDKQGNIWSYKGNAVIGQEVTLKMYDNHTSNIKDDIIKGVKIR